MGDKENSKQPQGELFNINTEQEEKKRELQRNLQILVNWLQSKALPAYREYQQARQEWEKWSKVGQRKIQSKQITELNIEISPEASAAKTRYELGKRDFYRAIRSVAELPLGKFQRQDIINFANQRQQKHSEPPPNLTQLLFPDESFSVTEADLANPNKSIDYNAFDYLIFVKNLYSSANSNHEHLRTRPAK